MHSLEELYREYSLPLYRFLLSLTASEHEAEELLQETFYRALMYVGRFEGRCSPLTWLCTIGKNLWFKELNKKKRYHSQPIEDMNVPDKMTILDEMVQKDEKIRLRRAICELQEPYRDVVLLHIYAERSLREIAGLYGKTESWARVTFYRAKQQLSEKLGGVV